MTSGGDTDGYRTIAMGTRSALWQGGLVLAAVLTAWPGAAAEEAPTCVPAPDAPPDVAECNYSPPYLLRMTPAVRERPNRSPETLVAAALLEFTPEPVWSERFGDAVRRERARNTTEEDVEEARDFHEDMIRAGDIYLFRRADVDGMVLIRWSVFEHGTRERIMTWDWALRRIDGEWRILGGAKPPPLQAINRRWLDADIGMPDTY